MSSSSNMSSLQIDANTLNYISMMFVRYFCCSIMPLGIIGHSLSIYVFTCPTLRSNPCSMYFLAATIVGMMVTCYTLPMRMVQSAFVNTDPGAYSLVFCKIVWFILYSLRGLCPWLIVLACADRYLCSSMSTTMRGWSTRRVANRVIPLSIFLGFLIYIHIPFFFTINIIPATQKPICYPPGPPGTYRVILSFFNLIYFGLFPSICMLLFGILTWRNIIRSKRLLARPANIIETRTNQRDRKMNIHMLRMLFIQVLVYCITGAPYSIATIYTSITASQSKDVFQVAQENLLTAIGGMLTNTGPCLSFYLFTLSSSLFRRELKKLFYRFNRIGNTRHQVQTQSTNTNHVHTHRRRNVEAREA